MMNEDEREKVLIQLKESLSKPGGKQAVRYVLNALGGIPIAGGFIAGLGSLQGEKEQQEINRLLLEWYSIADTEINKISEELSKLSKEPTKASFALLMGEIFGDEIATQLFMGVRSSIYIVLNSSTVIELEDYISKGWVYLRPTGSVCLMGAGNSVGNDAEDQKRAYGNGDGFILKINMDMI